MSYKLNRFLGSFPESNHPCDRKRFIEYAVECIQQGKELDKQALANAGLSQERIDHYVEIFDWISETCDVLSKQCNPL